MNIVGVRVKHNTFGIGVVKERREKSITVEFAAKIVSFIYPEAYGKFIKAENPDVHAAITKEIEDGKALAAQQLLADFAARKTAETQQHKQTATAAPKVEKAKNIDAMFGEDYHVEKLARQPVLTYQQVEEQFGIRITGFGKGINPTDSTVVLISAIGKSSGSFVYHDKWTADGEYIYSGEGRSGDQAMTKGNLAIKNAAQNGKKIHLFVKFSPQEYYYQGVFVLVDYTYEDDIGEDGNTRKEYKFRLRKASL